MEDNLSASGFFYVGNNNLAITLDAQNMYNRYIDNDFSTILTINDTIKDSLQHVYFLKINNLAKKIAFLAQKIFIVDANDFNEKTKDKNLKITLTDINQIIEELSRSKEGLNRSKVDTIFQVCLYGKVIVLIVDCNNFNNINNLFLATRNLIVTNHTFWKWVNQKEIQSNNIFADVLEAENIEVTYQKTYDVKNDLQDAATNLLQESFILIDDTQKNSLQNNWLNTLQQLTFNTVSAINNGINILNQNDSLDINSFMNIVAKKVQNALLNTTFVDTESVKKLVSKYGEKSVIVLNALAQKMPGGGTTFLNNVAADLLKKGYKIVNNTLQKKDATKDIILKDFIETQYSKDPDELIKSEEFTKNSHLVTYAFTLPEKAGKDVFFIDASDLSIRPFIFKAHKIILCGYDKADVFKSVSEGLVKNNEAGFIQIKQETLAQQNQKNSVQQNNVIDLTTIPDSCLILLLPENYFTTFAKHRLFADHIVAVSSAIQKYLSDESKNFNQYFSPLQKDTNGLIKFNLLLTENDILKTDSAFDGYPKSVHGNILIQGKLQNDLFNSYRGDRAPYSLTLPLQQTLSSEKSKLINDFDVQTLEYNRDSLIKQFEKLQLDLVDQKSGTFKTENCLKLFNISVGLSMLVPEFAKRYTTKKDPTGAYFQDVLSSQIDNNVFTILKTNDNFFIIVPKEALEILQKKGLEIHKAELYWQYYRIDQSKDDLFKTLNNIYNNKEDQKKDEPVFKNTDKKIELGQPSSFNVQERQKEQKKREGAAKPVWYKPWTWSWGGYYFKKESYQRDFPQKAAMHDQQYGYEKP